MDGRMVAGEDGYLGKRSEMADYKRQEEPFQREEAKSNKKKVNL